MKKMFFCWVFVIVILFTLAGCGGGGGGRNDTTITLFSEAALDGYIINRTAIPDFSGSGAGDTLEVGDMIIGGGHGPMRAYISFNIASIPTGATIQSAVLRMYKVSQSADAASAYSNLGNLLIDHVVYNPFTFDDVMFNMAALETLSPPFASSLTTVGQWKEMTVTDQVQNDISNSRGHAQFRLRFTNNQGTDLRDRYEQWASGDRATNKPKLVIVYTR